MRDRGTFCLILVALTMMLLTGCGKRERAKDQEPAPKAAPDAPVETAPAASAVAFERKPVPPSRSFRFTERELPEIKGPEKLESPMSLTASDGTGLRIVVLETLGVVETPLAFTQVRMVFENPENRQIEGRFRVTMPPGASISRFAMKLGDRWQEGEVVERQAARRAYEDFLHRRQDPALLEQQAGNVFTARVFPIPPRGRKELLVSYSQALDNSEEAYSIPLKGLPKLERLTLRVLVAKVAEGEAGSTLGGTRRSHEVVEVNKRDWIPDKDFEVKAPEVADRLGLRHENLVVARLAPDVEARTEEIGSLFVLVDTSASRALGFAEQIRLVRDLVEGLAAGAGAEVPLGVACFDQDTQIIHEGTAGEFGEAHLDAIRKRRALGASDLQGAFDWLAAHVQETGKKYERLLIVTDGVATAGATEGDKLREAVKALRPQGVARLDALVFGGIRDEAGLRALVTAGLERDGVVIDGKEGREKIASRLTHTTASDLKVQVEDAAWVWPTSLAGVQAGDEVLVYADLPAGKPVKVSLGDKTVDVTGMLHPAERPLLQRAWVKARIARLLHQRDTTAAGDQDMRAALTKQVVELSVKHRVLSPYTALLVLETERDYRRFNIDRRALADILTVGPDGIAVMNRSADSTAPLQVATPKPRTKLKSVEKSMKRRMSEEDKERDPSDSRQDANKIAREQGVLGVLGATGKGSGAMAADVFGGEDGDAGGFGGLSVSGRGRGGGGTVSESTAEAPSGIGRLGTRGRARPARKAESMKAPKPMEAPKSRPVPRVTAARVEVRGSLSMEVIRRVIRTRMAQIKYCYDRELQRNHSLQGKVTVEFVIGPTGKVTMAKVKSTTLNNAKVERCILAKVKTWRFPAPAGGGIVNVVFPFVFRPGSSARDLAGPIRSKKTAAYTGKFRKVMDLLARKKTQAAHDFAFGWREEDPGDVMALVALGETLEAAGKPKDAARAYGSLIDLFPARADIRRFAGERLEMLTDPGCLALAADTYGKAVEQRPDHPASHRLHAFALHKLGKHAEAFEAMKAGLARRYPSGRFAGVRRILREDLGLLAAAWIRAEPKRSGEILEKLKAAGGRAENKPSLRFVLNWETDANDVDFHIHDGIGGHASYQNTELPSGGQLYADVTTGYGPECFCIRNKPNRRAYPYRLQAHYYRRGPMGYGMGKLQTIEHDGEGGLKFLEHPFVVMKDGAYVDLGKVRGHLK